MAILGTLRTTDSMIIVLGCANISATGLDIDVSQLNQTIMRQDPSCAAENFANITVRNKNPACVPTTIESGGAISVFCAYSVTAGNDAVDYRIVIGASVGGVALVVLIGLFILLGPGRKRFFPYRDRAFG